MSNSAFTPTVATVFNDASASQSGLVNTGTQTFGGDKTFNGTVTASKLIPTGSSATGNGLYLPASNEIGISTNGSERLRVKSGGAIYIGTTSGSGKIIMNQENSAAYGAGFNIQRNGSTNANYELIIGGDNKLYLGYGASGAPDSVGNFATNGTYTATSDIRKKKDINYVFDGLEIVTKLKPSMGRMIDDNENSPLKPFLIAQDVKQILPSIVSSLDPNLDAVDPILGIDYSSLIPVLIKAIQEQQQIIELLKARIEILETKA